jgi:hypothetical protein
MYRDVGGKDLVLKVRYRMPINHHYKDWQSLGSLSLMP